MTRDVLTVPQNQRTGAGGGAARMIRVARTPEGIVARVIEPYGETEAWRLSPSGHIARAIGHKGPWIATAAMPAGVRGAIARHEEERP